MNLSIQPITTFTEKMRDMVGFKRSSSQAGFSLIELMVTVAIIGIIASIAIPNYGMFVKKAKVSKLTTGVQGLYVSIKSTQALYGSYPNTGHTWRLPTAYQNGFFAPCEDFTNYGSDNQAALNDYCDQVTDLYRGSSDLPDPMSGTTAWFILNSNGTDFKVMAYYFSGSEYSPLSDSAQASGRCNAAGVCWEVGMYSSPTSYTW